MVKSGRMELGDIIGLSSTTVT